MIDRTHDLPVVRQCRILNLARSTAYCAPQPTSPKKQVLMRRIDELHLEHPFADSRMLRDMLKLEGHLIGRKRVRTLMKKMGIESALPETESEPPACRTFDLPVPSPGFED